LIRLPTLLTMNRISRLWVSFVAGLLAVLSLPSVAWAAGSEVLVPVRRGIGFWGCSAICCLAVVGGIVAAIYLITRRRKS
jgi:hypothetical protein